SGISNRYVVMFGRDSKNMDSPYVIPATNFNNGILFQQYHPNGQKIIDVVQEKDWLNFFFRPANLPAPWGNLQPQTVTPNIFVENRLDKSYLLNQKESDSNEHVDGIKMEKINQRYSSDLFDNENQFEITSGNDFQTPF